jgi:hypothetical protein
MIGRYVTKEDFISQKLEYRILSDAGTRAHIVEILTQIQMNQDVSGWVEENAWFIAHEVDDIYEDGGPYRGHPHFLIEDAWSYTQDEEVKMKKVMTSNSVEPVDFEEIYEQSLVKANMIYLALEKYLNIPKLSEVDVEDMDIKDQELVSMLIGQFKGLIMPVEWYKRGMKEEAEHWLKQDDEYLMEIVGKKPEVIYDI